MEQFSRMVRTHGWKCFTDTVMSLLRCKDGLLDSSFDVEFVDTENIYNLNETLLREMYCSDLAKEHEVSGTNHLLLVGGNL